MEIQPRIGVRRDWADVDLGNVGVHQERLGGGHGNETARKRPVVYDQRET